MKPLDKYQEGQLLLIDKPYKWTSFDVVKKLRYALKVKKIGHAGTLDPLATGLLLIGTGKWTKKLEQLQGQDKSYEGIIEIGKTTPSYDLETKFDSEANIGHLTDADLEAARLKLSGPIEQVPPAHSAVKIDGERAYKKARRNEEVKMKVRNVQIHRFEIQSCLPEINFQIDCTKGTYIRSMAHDFGKHLGVGGYLKSLRRTRIGEHHVDQAKTVDQFLKELQEERADEDH